MCHLCQHPTLTRRRFLRLSLAAATSCFLAGCGVPPPSRASASGSFRSRAPTTAGFPTYAGRVAAAVDGTLALEAPMGNRVLPLADSIRQRVARGERVTVWLENGEATFIRHLPSIGANVFIPDDLEQPSPTGASRTLGSLEMVTRTGWGAAPAPQWVPSGEAAPFDATTNPAGWLVYPPPLTSWLTTLVVHHSALEFDAGPRAIQRLHMHRRGFADIGYHFIVDGLGQLYEGRPLNVRGAHTGGFNTGTIGVCLLGNFEIAPPIMAQLDTLRLLADHLRQEWGIGFLAGHRDFQPDVTVCPGSNLWPLLEELATGTGLAWGTDGYHSPPW